MVNMSAMSANDAKPENYLVNARICQLVAQCPFMYDRSHAQYLKKDVCDEAWLRIAKEMGESVSTCRERWRNIRTSFARSINTNKIACRANRTKPYYLHEELKFLLDYITPGVPVMRRYKKKATSNGESGGEESELIEVSVGEDTFNGFEHLSCTYGGENGDSTTQHEGDEDGHSKWQQQQQQQQQQQLLDSHSQMSLENGENGEVDERVAVGNGNGHVSCDSSIVDERLIGGKERDDVNNTNRLVRLPPPPLQAAPLSAFQRGADETEAAAALQQIQMSTMSTTSKRARLETQTSQAASDASAIHFLAEQQRRASRCSVGNNNVGGIGAFGVENVAGVAQEYAADYKLTTESHLDAGFLQELQLELRSMDRYQKIHFKRRVYEALTEIYPMSVSTTVQKVAAPPPPPPPLPPLSIDISTTTAGAANLIEMPRPILLAKPQQLPLASVGSHVATQVTRQDLAVTPCWQPLKRTRSEAAHVNGNHSAATSPTPSTNNNNNNNEVIATPAAAATSKRQSSKILTRSSINESSSVAITRSATAERRHRPFNQQQHSQSQQSGSTQSVKDEPDGDTFSE